MVAVVGASLGCEVVPRFSGVVSGTIIVNEDDSRLVRVGAFEQTGKALATGGLAEYRIDIDTEADGLATLRPLDVFDHNIREVPIESDFPRDNVWEINLPNDRVGDVVILGWRDDNRDLLWNPEEPGWLPRRLLAHRGEPAETFLVGVAMEGDARFYGNAESGRDEFTIEDEESIDWDIVIDP